MQTRGQFHRWILATAITGATISRPAFAQDPFEIQVYEYETVPKGKWNLETHFNYTVRGTRTFDDGVAPSEHQAHLTFEFTRGISPEFELAGYLLLADRPGAGVEYAGWRFRPRVMVPKAWHWPVGVSLSAEVGFPRRVYEDNSVTFELRPIIEKRFGVVQVDVNPTLGRSLKGPGSASGWDFEPGARFAVSATSKLDLSVEYYGALGPVDNLAPRNDQVHQVFLGGDWQFRPDLIWNFGWGWGLTPAGNQGVLKMRLGWLF